MKKVFLPLLIIALAATTALADSNYRVQASDPDLLVLSPSSDTTVNLLNSSYTYGRVFTVVNRGSAQVFIKDSSATPATIKTVAGGTTAAVACTTALCESAADWSTISSGSIDEESGTLNGSFSGPFTTTQNLTITYKRIGQMTTLTFPAMYAACSVATGTATYSLTLGTSLRPGATLRNALIAITDNSANTMNPGVVEISVSGSIKVYKTTQINTINFSTTGNCGWEGFSVTFNN